jgi:ABC-type uncharacterized transport system substrate-binding protein
MRRIHLVAAAAALSLAFISCGPAGLKSDNYWNGSEKELAWARKHAAAGSGSPDAAAQEKETIPEPHLRDGKGKFRVAVVISGEYWEFFDNLKGLIEGFANIGWARHVAVPASLSTSRQLIQWLSAQDYSDYVEFEPSLFYDLGWGDNMAELERAFDASKPEADLVMAYGGMAGKFFYKNKDYPLPVIADAITDPIAAGVALGPDDSGKDFFSCKMDTEQFLRQIRIFHDITGFKRLGIVYGDDEYGTIYGAVRDVETAAKELGFEIVRNTKVKEEMAPDTVDLYLAALKDVASRSDAVYIGASTAVTEYDSLGRITEILDAAKVPSFALEGSIRVKGGILLSLSSSGTIRSGIYTATKIAKVFGGLKPRALPQRFESITSLAVNLATAEKIGFRVPVDVIINSDEVYSSRDGSGPAQGRRSRKASGGLEDFASASGQTMRTMEPQRRPDGKPYRVGVVVSGSYWEFDQHFRGILNGLASEKWGKASFSADGAARGVKEQIQALSGFSEYIEFPADRFIDLKWGEDPKAMARVSSWTEPDVDLVIAFGGVAGKIFSGFKDYPVPVLVEGITDPVGSGIIYSVEDSGRDFLTCRVDPGQYQRQIQLFHDFVGFKRLGIIYGDGDYGRLYGAVHDVDLAASKIGFEVVRNTKVKEKLSPDTPKLYLDALRDICGKVDAVYLGASTALTEYDIAGEAAKILIDAKVPSFSLEGEIRVREGVMLGVSSTESEKFGLYNAQKIIAMLAGESPRALNQKMEGVPSIVLNLGTARKIGRDIPLSVLSTIDQIYY